MVFRKIELITEYGESSDSEEEVTTKPNGSAKLSSLATPSTVTTIKSKKATSSPVLPDKNAKVSGLACKCYLTFNFLSLWWQKIIEVTF